MRANPKSPDVGPLLSRLRGVLGAAFQERLRGIVLYGSAARGDGGETSDIDILVLLDRPVSLGRELEVIVRAMYPLQLETEWPIHALPVDVADFEAGEFALYRNARKDGLFA